jgi:alpha-beta hydrolase superfamily lysophospholipase
MPPAEAAVQSRDGLTLRLYQWWPEAEPKAVITFTHGGGEYATKYTHIARALNAAGYAWVAHDLRGHGRSGGPRGHVPGYEAFLSDLDRVLAHVRHLAAGKPLFLFGHSLGGQITAAYVLDRQPLVGGVILNAPWLRLLFQPAGWKMYLAQMLTRLWPSFALTTGLDGSVKMTHDATLEASYPDLDLGHSMMSARLGMEALARGEEVFLRAPEWQTPLLLLHGGADGVFAASSSQDFFERVASTDKTLHLYPGLYHETLNEIERDMVIADVAGWLDARIG